MSCFLVVFESFSLNFEEKSLLFESSLNFDYKSLIFESSVNKGLFPTASEGTVVIPRSKTKRREETHYSDILAVGSFPR